MVTGVRKNECVLKLPDLYSPRDVQTWFSQARNSGVSTDEILSALQSHKTDIALLRSVCVSYWSGERDDFWKLADAALESNEFVIRAYVQSLVIYQKVVQAYALNNRPHFLEVVGFQSNLLQIVSELDQCEESPLIYEAESSLRLALALTWIVLNYLDFATDHALRAAKISSQIDAMISMTRARTQLISIYGNAAKYTQAVETIIAQPLGKTVPESHQYYQQAVLVSSLSHLGSGQDAHRTLLSLLSSHSSPSLSAALQRLECLWGIGGMEGDIVGDLVHKSPRGWIVESLRKFLEAEGLPKLNQNQKRRDQCYQRAVEICKAVTFFSGPWYKTLNCWIIARAYQGLGKLALASAQIAEYQVANREMLDIRVLFAGLRLELSLSPYLPDLSPTRAEQELREVFADAATIPHASRTGLAQLLQRWHPLAAAYAAVMPNPIPELEFATQAILEAGERCQVYGLPMPPVYATELILRTLGWDSRKDRGFVQSPLNKREIAQRDALASHYGAVPYWRPVVTGMQLVFGLAKAGQGRPEYALAAQRILHSYGLLPQSKNAYAQHELGLVHTGVQGLANGALSAQDFARMVYQS